MNRKKIILSFLLTCLMMLSFSSFALADDTVIDDSAELFTADELTDLTTQINEKKAEMNVAIVVVTTNDAEGKDAETYADDYYDTNIGIDVDGVLLLIDMENRNYYISTSGSMIRYLTDARIKTMKSSIAPYLSDGDYTSAVTTFLNDTYNYYQEGIPSNQYNQDTETGKISRYKSISLFEGIIAVICGLATAISIFVITMNRYNLSKSSYKYNFNQKGSLDLTVNQDTLVNSFVTTRRIPPPPPSGGGSGGGMSSTHTSSGGGTHGGGGGSF